MITKCILLYLVVLLCTKFGESIQSKNCIMNTSTNECVCPKGYKNENGICEAECTIPCGKGTCFKPNQCLCFEGYKIDIKRLRRQTAEKLPICAPSCKNCIGECVAPETCIVTTTPAPTTSILLATTVIPTTSTIVTPTTVATSTTVEILTTNTTAVTKSLATTVIPTTSIIITPTTMTTSAIAQTLATNTTVATPTTTVAPTTPLIPITSTSKKTNSTTTVPATTAIPITTSTTVTPTTTVSTTYKFGFETTTEKVVVAHTLDPSLLESKATKQALKAQDWLFLILSLVIASAIIFLLVWRKPIIRFFKGRSYVVEDDRPGRNRVQYSRTAQEDSKDAYC